jgi:hypothetical protein
MLFIHADQVKNDKTVITFRDLKASYLKKTAPGEAGTP